LTACDVTRSATSSGPLNRASLATPLDAIGLALASAVAAPLGKPARNVPASCRG
jgi:hypothetical protein